MRNPLRTEAEAFSFVLVVGILFLAVALAGVRYGGEVALVVFGSLVLGAAVGVYLRSEPKVREPAVWERRPGERKRILVVANETLAGSALRTAVRDRVAVEETDVLVVAPVVSAPRADGQVADAVGARGEASRRLEELLASLAADGVAARGEVRDGDPLAAIDEALATFDADEIVVSTRPAEGAEWLARYVVRRARERYSRPVTHVVVDVER